MMDSNLVRAADDGDSCPNNGYNDSQCDQFNDGYEGGIGKNLRHFTTSDIFFHIFSNGRSYLLDCHT